MKVLTIIALTAAAFAQGTPARAADCDRACLASLMERYLVALDAHNPGLLPLARGAKFTENTVALTLGDGFWQTIDKGSQSSSSRLIIADPATSQVAFYGAAKENGHGVLFGVRLKHKAQRISEIEQFVIRRGPAQIGEFDNPPAFEAAWTEVLPTPERLPRAELVRIANLYFEGIEKSSGDIVPLVPETSRVENGFRTAPRAPAADGTPAESIQASFSSGRYRYIREIKPRRFLLVDEERGLVYTMVMFHHPGNVMGLPMWDKQYKDPTSIINFPNSMAMTEAFRIRGGKITHIVAQMVMLPYRQPTGWPVR
ncbi:MAG TPA: hypothetical protein VNQ32_08875 [Steroidobacteraceae bacterium]|nr:hypothetical protein [Steroidobacteraceae bacterium]